MARGVLSGMLWGTVTAGLGLSAISLSTDIPGAAPPEAEAKMNVAPPAKASEETSAPAQPQEDNAPSAVAVPEAQAPARPSSIETVDTSPAQKPDATAQVLDALPDPVEDSGEAVAVAAVDDAGVTGLPSAPAVAERPQVGTAPKVEIETPAPALPQEEDVEPMDTGAIAAAPEAGDAAIVEEEAANAEEGGAAPEVQASLVTPSTPLISAQSKRLPSIGNATTAEPAKAAAEQATPDVAMRPIEAFAAPFEAKADLAKMAIVLIDDGTSDIGVDALASFPYPLSFAIDSSWSGAKAAMERYRAAGFEVLAMVNMPNGARAADVEVALPVLLANVPEAVGIMETPGGGLQSSREVSAQTTDYLAASGHGMLFFPKGLDTARKLAQKEGVPAATVFRDFDAQGQNASAIKRFFNHAALKADSEGGVVMVGRLRADTVSALLLWGLQDRSSRVELAPISQLLQVQGGQ